MFNCLKRGIEENKDLIAVCNAHHVLEVFGVEGLAFSRRVKDEDVNAIIILLMGYDGLFGGLAYSNLQRFPEKGVN